MSLNGKTILFFAGPLYEDLELWYPKIRLEEEGASRRRTGGFRRSGPIPAVATREGPRGKLSIGQCAVVADRKRQYPGLRGSCGRGRRRSRTRHQERPAPARRNTSTVGHQQGHSAGAHRSHGTAGPAQIPFLFLHGIKGRTVAVENSLRLAARSLRAFAQHRRSKGR